MKVIPRIVIDTDVLSSVPKDAGLLHPCRDFLETMRKLGFVVVMTPRISKEWEAHRSRFGTLWRVQMQSRNQVHFAKGDAYASLPDQIDACDAGPAQKGAMKKDAHLIAAAIETDRRIASMDQTARTLFREHFRILSRLSDVVWINPAFAADTPIEWLRIGAPADAHRMLGSTAARPSF
jgi:hypothetical protein